MATGAVTLPDTSSCVSSVGTRSGSASVMSLRAPGRSTTKEVRAARGACSRTHAAAPRARVGHTASATSMRPAPKRCTKASVTGTASAKEP